MGRPVGGFALGFGIGAEAVPGSEPYREAVACSDLFRGGGLDFPFSHDLSNAGSRASAVGAPSHSVVPGAAPRAAAPRRARAAGLSRYTPKEGFSYEASRGVVGRSEEHTSELQSRLHLVCRLLLEKKKKNYQDNRHV